MSLDIRTIVLMMLVCAVLMTVTLALGIRRSHAPGLRNWNLGQGLYAAGWILIVSRGVLPAEISVALADGLLLQGLCAQIAGIRQFAGRPVPRWTWVPGPLLALLVLPLLDDYAALTLLASACYAVAFAVLAVLMVRLDRRAGPVRLLTAGIMTAGALLLMARAVDIALRPPLEGVFSDSLLHAVAFVAMFVLTVVSSFAFLVMQRERAEQELRHLAMHDPLTDVFNRGAFLKLAEREVARAGRSGEGFAVLMLDLDHFKNVNDTYGHQAGDAVLAEFAERVQQGLRVPDLVGRYGGEEFCAFLPGVDHAGALAIAERVRAAVAAAPLGGLPECVTVSIGLASFGGRGARGLDYVIGRADSALYAAKGLGRNRVVGIQPTARDGSRTEQLLAA